MVKIVLIGDPRKKKDEKAIPAVLFRSKERNKILIIAKYPVEVSEHEYSILKERYGNMIVKATEKNVPEPMKIKFGDKGIKKPKTKVPEKPKVEPKIEVKEKVGPKVVVKAKPKIQTKLKPKAKKGLFAKVKEKLKRKK